MTGKSIEWIHHGNSRADKVIDVSSSDLKAIHYRRGCDHAVDDRELVWRLQSAPELRDFFGDVQDTTRVVSFELQQSVLDCLSLRCIFGSEKLDPISDLPDCQSTDEVANVHCGLHPCGYFRAAFLLFAKLGDNVSIEQVTHSKITFQCSSVDLDLGGKNSSGRGSPSLIRNSIKLGRRFSSAVRDTSFSASVRMRWCSSCSETPRACACRRSLSSSSFSMFLSSRRDTSQAAFRLTMCHSMNWGDVSC